MIMANFQVAFIALLLLFIVAAGGYSPSSTVDIEFDVTGCQGTIGECFDQEEFLVDSESNRRILASRRYISYGALRRNHVPCSRRGASYYNCRPGAAANPYRRGCSRITRCRR